MARSNGSKGNRFERYPKVTIGILILLFLLLSVTMIEVFLKKASGLGNPVLYDINPLYGYRPKPNQVIEPVGGIGFLYASRVTINNIGLRAAGEWDTSPSKKILFLGDSVTYGGQYVADSQLFSTIAGEALPAWQVGNGGVNAWGVENIVGLVMDSGFSPAEVIVTCVIEGDFYRGITRVGSVPFWIEMPQFALQNLLMHNIWRLNESRYGSSTDYVVQDEEQLDKIVDRAAKRLRELDSYLTNKQIQHFIFILPSKGQVLNSAQKDRRVHQALQRHNINANYLLPKLQLLEKDETKRREWFHDNVHLEQPGHHAYGTIIGKEISTQLTNH